MFKRIALLIICLVVLFSFSQLIAQEATEDEEALRQALLDIAVAFENGDYAAIRIHIADDYVVHSPFGDLDWPAVEGLFTALSNALTDYTVTRDPVLVEGNLTTTRTVVSGVFENEFAGPMGVFPPTGQPFTLEYINILQFDENGQVIEEWVQFDVLNFMTQLGAMGDATQEAAVDEDERRQTILDITAELANGNYDAVSTHVADRYVVHTPLGDMNWAGVQGLFTALSNALTDFDIVPHQVIVEGNFATMRSTVSGVFENDFAGPMGVLPPTGQPFAIELINIWQFDDNGMIVEEWAQYDVLNFMTQLGAMGDATQAVTEDEETLRQAVIDIDTNLADGNYEAARSYVTDDFVLHSPFGDLDWSAAEGLFTSLTSALTDFTITQDPLLVEGNLVATHTIITGVFENEFVSAMGVFPPTGQPFTLEYISIMRFDENGKAVEEWAQFDVLNFMTQLGAMGDAAQDSGQ